MLVHFFRSALIVFMSFMLATVSAYGAPSLPRPDKKLKTIQHDIAVLNKNIEKKQSDEIKLQKNLVATEAKITEINNKLAPLTTSLEAHKQKLTWLSQEQTRYQEQLKAQQTILAQLITARYHNRSYREQDAWLRLILSQNSVDTMQRILQYYPYLQDAELKHLSAFRRTLTKLETNQSAVKSETSELLDTQRRYAEEDQKLQKNMQARQHLLLNLRAELKSDRSRLEQLKLDAQKLEQMVAQLSRAQAASPQAYKNPTGRPFNHYRGHLNLPTGGSIVHRFGTPIENSELNWKGILIAANPGQGVKSVAAGKVIFAEFLRGYGLLLIIDHGQNYLTLYGRNQALFKKVGDIVKPGETIAKVGQTGGYDQAGLYFEVRYHGQPIDPERWLAT